MFYAKPSKMLQMTNSAVSWLATLGLTPSDTVTIEVKGRHSGKIRSNAVTWVEHDGKRYLVSPRGESEWVRNVRAPGGDAAIRHRGRQQVRLEEIATELRAPILQLYLKKTASATKQHFDVAPNADVGAFAGVAAEHPVFLVTEAG